jgi:four helix bundle protein
MEGAMMVRDIRERSFEFAARIVKLCITLDEKPGVARVLGNQLLRAGTSIGANVEEAQAGQSRPDFISKNAIALKEARETLYWLRLLAATGIVPDQRLTEIRVEAEELTRIIGAIIVSAKKIKL